MLEQLFSTIKTEKTQILNNTHTGLQNSLSKKHFKFYCWMLFLFCTFFLSSCASFVTVDVEWKQPIPDKKDMYSVSDCENEGLGKITAKVYKGSKSKVIATNSWPCTDEGKKQVKVRTFFNRKMDTTIVISGEDSKGNVLFLGKNTTVSIPSDETHSIDAYEFIPALIDVKQDQIEWHPVKGASEYRVLVASSISFKQIIIDEIVKETTFVPDIPNVNKIYFCKVHARNQNGIQGGASEVWSFISSKPEKNKE